MTSSLVTIFVTDIKFKVKVPVLSVQIIFAPPIVSHACIFLTKLLLSINFLIEKAKLRVTANGNPSGIATTIIETHNIIIVKTFLIISGKENSSLVKYLYNIWIDNAIKVRTALPNPKYPIISAISFNLFSKGVLLSSWALSIVPLMIPFCEWAPIAIAIALPEPSITSVPLNRIIELGLLFPDSYSSLHFSYGFLVTAFDSPVRELSSILIPFPSTKIISAGKISP